MLAKGRLLGIQFGELLRDSLYIELRHYGGRMVDKIRKTCRDREIPFLVASTTNQVLPVMLDALLEQWKDKYSYTNQGRVDETHTATRSCTSWVISEEHVNTLVKDILNNQHLECI